MNSNDIFYHLRAIQGTSRKNEKVALVAKYADDEDWKRVLKAALNPLVSYGVKQLPPVNNKGATGEFGQGTWLLIEDLAKRALTGHAARDAIQAEFDRLDVPSQHLLRRILLKKLDAGFDASTTNKAIPKLIPVFPYMRCSLPKDVKLDEFGWDKGVISQEKADGMFMNLDYDQAGVIRLTSRQGTEFPMDAFEEFAASVARTLTPGMQTHGEMVVMRHPTNLPRAPRDDEWTICSRQDGNGILNHIEAGGSFAENERPLFLAWDQIPLEAVVPKGKYTVGYRQRLGALVSQIRANPTPHIKLIPTKIVYSMKEAWDHYRELLAQGKEGTVAKKGTAMWKDGTSQEQIKLKLKAPFEVRVRGFNYGTGKNAGKVSSLQTASECELLQVNVPCRGDAMIAEITADPESWRDAIITAEGNGILEPGESNPLHSVFLPIFVERRKDKSEADDLARIRQQFENAIAAA